MRTKREEVESRSVEEIKVKRGWWREEGRGGKLLIKLTLDFENERKGNRIR